MGKIPSISPARFGAVLFDLDGVLTQTAKIHAACWKEMFDDYLRRRASEKNEPFRPFDIVEDYKQYVDGKPRDDGVRNFLQARGIDLPEGKFEDPPGGETVHGLSNQKNERVNQAIDTQGVEPYDDAVALARWTRQNGLRTAVVSSSRNCEKVLRAAGIVDLFEMWVDGNVTGELGLAGKPAPDSFLHAARELGVEPARAVVVEDAIAGVQSGRAGGFGLVIGVHRHGDREALERAGADVVVEDLGEIPREPAER